MFPRSLLLAVVLVASVAHAEAPASPASPPPPTPLTREPQTRELRGGETQSWSITLEPGQFARVVVLQRGADVVATAFAPSGKQLVEVDSPNGTSGPEPVPLVAGERGTYRIEVRSLDARAPTGGYQIAIEIQLSAEEYRASSTIELPRATLLAYQGAYQLEPGRVVAIGLMADAGFRLVFADTGSGRTGVLHAHADGEFFTGPTLLAEYPVAMRFRFRKDARGRVDALELSEGNAPARLATRLGGRREEISVAREGVRLAGTLHLPEGAGPFPALVLAHGSGPFTRHIGAYPAFFTSLGFAVLALDKRGAGDSQGDFRTASFEVLAGDLVASVELLGQRADIDGKRIGVFAISQGGWVATLAAARSPAVAFLLVLVGSGVPVWENVAHESVSQMRDAGLRGKPLAQGTAFARALYRLAARGGPPAAIGKLIRSHQGKPYLSAVFLAQEPPDSPWWAWFAANGQVDPRRLVARLHVPVLWVLGERDAQVPTAISAPRLRAGFRAGKNPQATVTVLPRAGHPLLACDTCLPSELPALTAFAPGFFAMLSTWLAAR